MERNGIHKLQAAVKARVPRTGAVLAGVSGGADSLALLHLLAEAMPDARRRLVAVHVHHGLRGADADRDQRWVENQCRRLRVPCLVYRRDVRAEAERHKLSLESAGRLARQECFLAAARLFNARAVFLAHHQDDQAETLLLNLLRGAGGRGLAGLRVSRAFPHPQAPAGLRLLRPLLSAPKAELEAYLRRAGVRWRRDLSNADPAFARNRIRTQLLPYLEKEFNPRIGPLLARSAEALARDNDLLDEWTTRRLKRLPHPEAGRGLAWPRAGLRRLPEALQWRLLSEAWDRLGIPGKTSEHLAGLLQALHVDTAGSELPGRWRVRSKADRLEFRPPESPGISSEKKRILSGRFSGYGVESVPVSGPVALRDVPAGADFFYADAVKITGPLAVRGRRPGDSMRPLGLKGRTKTVKKILSEMRVPAAQRAAWPILTLSGEIIWIYRGPVSETVKADAATCNILKIRIIPSDKEGRRKNKCERRISITDSEK